jgi:hypothetical protein
VLPCCVLQACSGRGWKAMNINNSQSTQRLSHLLSHLTIISAVAVLCGAGWWLLRAERTLRSRCLTRGEASPAAALRASGPTSTQPPSHAFKSRSCRCGVAAGVSLCALVDLCCGVCAAGPCWHRCCSLLCSNGGPSSLLNSQVTRAV